MASAKVPVTFTPVDARKVEAALARIQSQAKGVNFGKGAESINQLSRPLGKITGQANEFQKSLEASNARVLAFGASVAVINKLSQAFGALVSNTIKVEASFAKINTILGGTQKELERFGNGIFKVAQQTGTSFDQVAEGALELARQGLSVEQSLSRVETALKLVRVSGIDAEKAVGGLTAAIKGFEGAGLTVAQIADKLAEVDTKFAVSTEDLINGLERASASARVAGVSFDELLGVVTTVQERTQRGGAVIGNAFKTIFARLGRTDTLQALESLGINVLDAQGNVRGAIPLFKELAVELDKLGIKSIEAGNIIQKVAGVRQRDILISLIEDLNSGQSQFAKSLQVSAGAAGALDEKNNKLNQTLEALINNLTVGSQKLASVLGDLGFSEAAGDIIKALSSVVNGITDLLQGEGPGAKFAQGLIKGIGSVLTGPGLALISAIFIKLFVDLAKFGATSLKQILGINKAAQQQATLQQSVLQTLLQNENIQREILALEGNKVAQEQLLLQIYNQQAAALARVQKAAATVTPGLFTGGFRGGEGGVGKTGRGAGGYVAAEARDVSRGVGGATAGSKVVSIPNFAFGGGQRGTMVANSSEYFVPNYAGGGDAIFNQNMVKAMGLPSGARKINAAGGFIPNFADVERMPLSEVNRALGNKKFANPTNPKIRNEKAGLLRRKRELNKGKKNLGIPANMFAMIVPSLKRKNEIRKGQRGSSNEGLQFTVVGYKGLAAAERGVSNDEQLDKATEKFALDKAFSESKLISGGRPTSKKLQELSNQGAISALSGAIFETAVSSLLKSDQFDPRRDPNARFDFLGDEGLDVLFNLPEGTQFIDAKIRNSPDMQKSMFGKMKKQLGRAAGGFVPNFAGGGLQDAIAREQAAGLPINQIRVNQNAKLRNASNPMGLAVTNTRDEPTGAIPNFAVVSRLGSKGGNASLDKASASAENMASSFDGLSTKLIALQLVMSATTNTFAEQNETVGKIQNAFGSLLNSLLVLSFTGAFKTKTVPGKSFKAENARIDEFNKRNNRNLKGSLKKPLPKLASPSTARMGMMGPAGIGFLISDFLTRLVPKDASLFGMPMGGNEAGVLGNLVELTSGISGKTTQDIIVGDARKQAQNVIQGGTSQEADVLVSSLEAQVAEFSRKDPFGKLGGSLFGVNDKVIAGLKEQIKLLKERRGELEETEVIIDIERGLKTGELIRKDTASRGVTKFFGQRESRIELDAAKGQARGDQLLRQAQTEERKAEITIQKEKLELIKKESLARNENLNNITQGVIKSKELNVVDKESLVNILASVDANTNSVKLARELKKEFGLTGEEAKKLVEQGLLNKQNLDESSQRAHDLLEIRKQQLIEEAKIADAQNRITQGYRLAAELVKQSRISDEEKLSTLQLSMNSGTALSPQQKRDIEFEIGKIERAKKVQGILDQQAAKRREISIEEEKGAEKNKETLRLLKAEQTTLILQEESLKRINAIEEKRAKQVSGQTKLEQSNEARRQSLKDLTEDVPDRLANNLESSIGSALDNLAMGTYDSLGDVFLNIALDFGRALQQEISRAAAKSLVESFTSSGTGSGFFEGVGNFFSGFSKKNSGGLIAGGSGVRDDVPAVLTGGEYVVRKSAVQKYGPDFLDRLNSGAIKGMQAGGFFVPGTRGQGEISGKENLLAFAQQGATSGATDTIRSTGSGASINLETQSARLTAFGRMRDSPARRALKEAQQQSFDLYVARIEEEKRAAEERRAAKKARRGALKSAIIGSFVNAAAAGVGSFFQSGGFGSSAGNLGMTDLAPSSAGGYTPGGAFNPNYVPSTIQYAANGGQMSGATNALLMGGEYVMSAPAASQIGRQNLDDINNMRMPPMMMANGGAFGNVTSDSSGGSSESKADVGAVNIEINMDKDGSAAVSADSEGNADPTKTKEFAKKIKAVVVNVIAEEKRVSGSLFARNK